MRYLLLFLIVIHGLIHLMGFAKAFNYGSMTQLRHPIPPAAGVVWLAVALLFLAAAGLVLTHQDNWFWAALPAVALSQVLIVMVWSDAKFGTVANLIIFAAAVTAALASRPDAYHNRYNAVIRDSIRNQADATLVSEADLTQLPALIQTYLRISGAVGRPKISNFRVVFTGQFRNGFKAPPMNFRSEQVNTLNPPVRAFLMQARMYGLPLEGFHLFQSGHATMQIKLASAFTVADAGGPRMDQSETVTFFNDLCLFAPAALIDDALSIEWKEDGPATVRATFSLAGQKIHALLKFNDRGELIDFVSEDRFLSADGKTYQQYPWSTPVSAYEERDGRRVPSRAETIWHMPEGPFTYGTFNLVEVEYNVRPGADATRDAGTASDPHAQRGGRAPDTRAARP